MFFRKVLTGKGSRRPAGYSIPEEIQNARMRLIESAHVLKFTNCEGWRFIKEEYELLIDSMRREKERLEADVETNVHGIQIYWNYINAMSRLLDLTDNLVNEHEDRQREYEKVRTVQRRVETGQGVM